MAQCPVCGADVFQGDRICRDCGTDLQDQAERPVDVAPAAPEPVAPVEAEETLAPPTTAGTAPGLPEATLVLKRAGALTCESFELKGAVLCLGRFDPDSGPVDIDLSALSEAIYVSRRHAQLRRDADGNWYVKDLGSTNGTFLRSPGDEAFRRITEEAQIRDGDELALGNARFEFHANP